MGECVGMGVGARVEGVEEDEEGEAEGDDDDGRIDDSKVLG